MSAVMLHTDCHGESLKCGVCSLCRSVRFAPPNSGINVISLCSVNRGSAVLFVFKSGAVADLRCLHS